VSTQEVNLWNLIWIYSAIMNLMRVWKKAFWVWIFTMWQIRLIYMHSTVCMARSLYVTCQYCVKMAALMELVFSKHRSWPFLITVLSSLFSGVPFDGVLPCRRCVARVFGQWIPMLADYIRVDTPQPSGTWASERHPPITGWLERWWSCLKPARATCPKNGAIFLE